MIFGRGGKLTIRKTMQRLCVIGNLLLNREYAKVQFLLGFMCSNGEGMPMNDNTAVKWYALAVE